MKELDVLTGTDEWLAERRKYDTASEASAMMGAGKVSRSDLMRSKSSGLDPERSQWVEDVLFANGDKVEAAARPLAEAILEEELYPTVAVSDDDTLLASFDGITMLEDTVWECKQWNADKAACVAQHECPPVDYWQVIQQLDVSGADQCLYMVTDGETEVHCWVMRDEDAFQRLRDGWRQFNKDLASYEPPETDKPVTGQAPESLPALHIEVDGKVKASNLDDFKAKATAVFQGISTELETDEDFANADATVKWCKQVEQRLDGAKDAALNQTADIYEVLTSLDDIKEESRKKRLALKKLVDEEKTRRKEEILADAERDYDAHIEAIERNLDSSCGHAVAFPAPSPGIAAAMKNKRSMKSLKDAAGTAAANGKIEASNIERGIRASIDALNEAAWGHETLFPDAGQMVVQKSAEDLRNLAAARIAEHRENERLKQEQARMQEERRQEQQRQEQQQQEERRQAAEQARAEPTSAPADAGPISDDSGDATVTGPDPVPSTPRAAAQPERPADAQIVAAVAAHFVVKKTTAADWIADMFTVPA